MQYFITKTGLDAFDTARAWGLGIILNTLTSAEVVIEDLGWAYQLKPLASQNLDPTLLKTNSQWGALFAEDGWRRVFLTTRSGWEAKRDQVRSILEHASTFLCHDLTRPDNSVKFGTGETLPGGLDPAGFKGLRHATRASYTEDQLRVDRNHWALACLGMALCANYSFDGVWLVALPVPERVYLDYFRDIHTLFNVSSLRYHGSQNAAAHYAVQLVERVRQRAASAGSLRDYFSAVIYFSLFKTRQQIKPGQGGQLRLKPLMDAIARDHHNTESMLRWLDACFRLGAVEGAEDLGIAATELVMRWDIDSYERVMITLGRVIGRLQVQRRGPRSFDSVLYTTNSKAMKVTMEVLDDTGV